MNYYTPFLILLISILIFHLLFIYKKKKSKLFWKIIDYIWISLGIIGIYGSTFSLRKEYSNARSYMLSNYLKSDYQGIIETTNTNVKYFSPDSIGLDYKNFNNIELAENFKKADTFYKSFSKLVMKYENRILKNDEFYLIDSLDQNLKNLKLITNDTHILDSSKGIDFFISQIKDTKNNIIENNILGEKNSLNWYVLFLSPYIFSIALGLRITKVTAEIKDLK